jgi:Transposase DDE domain group 1
LEENRTVSVSAQRAERITIDLDPTVDPTHGQQPLTFFNGHYDTACDLPLVATLTFNDEPTQHLVGIVLRPGHSTATHGAIGRVRALFAPLRAAFPAARLRVRLDGGFTGNPLFDFLEAEGVEYVVACPAHMPDALAGRVHVRLAHGRAFGPPPCCADPLQPFWTTQSPRLPATPLPCPGKSVQSMGTQAPKFV